MPASNSSALSASWSATASCAVAWCEGEHQEQPDDLRDRFTQVLSLLLSHVGEDARPTIYISESKSDSLQGFAAETTARGQERLAMAEARIIISKYGIGLCWNHGLGDAVVTDLIIAAVIYARTPFPSDDWRTPRRVELFKSAARHFRTLDKKKFAMRRFGTKLRVSLLRSYQRATVDYVAGADQMQSAIVVEELDASALEQVAKARFKQGAGFSPFLFCLVANHLYEMGHLKEPVAARILASLRRYEPSLSYSMSNLVGSIDFALKLPADPGVVGREMQSAVQSGELYYFHVLKESIDAIKSVRKSHKKVSDRPVHQDDGKDAKLTWSDRSKSEPLPEVTTKGVRVVQLVAFTPAPPGRIAFNLSQLGDRLQIACTFDANLWSREEMAEAMRSFCRMPTAARTTRA